MNLPHLLLTPSHLLPPFENGAKRFRVSTTGSGAFVSRVTRAFVNGAERRFVSARSAQLTVHELTRI